MGYADYLKRMLKPLGVYRLDSGYSAAELDAVGDAFDKVSAVLDGHLDGTTYTKMGGDYLSLFENLFPIVDFSESEEKRRENVLTLLSSFGAHSDKASLEAMLAACGLNAEISETDEKFILNLHFADIRGELTERQRKVCEAIMPCHTALNFICDGLTWDAAEARFPTWDDFDNCGLTAFEFVKLK